jgi:hypothetical protein
MALSSLRSSKNSIRAAKKFMQALDPVPNVTARIPFENPL